jgi:predicted kinase
MTDRTVDQKRLKRIAALNKYDADRLEKSLGRLPKPMARPAMVVLIGLPGSGKSHLARAIAARVPAAVLDIDALRAALFEDPQHTAKEHGRLFPALHVLMDRLLARRITVIVDATNLKEANRKPYYKIVAEHGAKLLLVRVWARTPVIRRRLLARAQSPDPADRSTATQEVYERMRDGAEPVHRRHVSVDTSKDTRPAVDKIAALLQS